MSSIRMLSNKFFVESIEEGARFEGKRALSKAYQYYITCTLIKNENPRLQRDYWMLGTYIIDD
jgi:hypothetical protein